MYATEGEAGSAPVEPGSAGGMAGAARPAGCITRHLCLRHRHRQQLVSDRDGAALRKGVTNCVSGREPQAHLHVLALESCIWISVASKLAAHTRQKRRTSRGQDLCRFTAAQSACAHSTDALRVHQASAAMFLTIADCPAGCTVNVLKASWSATINKVHPSRVLVNSAPPPPPPPVCPCCVLVLALDWTKRISSSSRTYSISAGATRTLEQLDQARAPRRMRWRQLRLPSAQAWSCRSGDDGCTVKALSQVLSDRPRCKKRKLTVERCAL